MSTRLRRLRERAKIVRNWRRQAEKIAEAAVRVLGEEVRVYAFGSIIKGDATPSSDIDLLIVVPGPVSSLRARTKILLRVEKAAGLGDLHPFEIHIVDSDEAASYFRHAGKNMQALNIA